MLHDGLWKHVKCTVRDGLSGMWEAACQVTCAVQRDFEVLMHSFSFLVGGQAVLVAQLAGLVTLLLSVLGRMEKGDESQFGTRNTQWTLSVVFELVAKKGKPARVLQRDAMLGQ